MIAAFFVLFVALTGVYVVFLHRVRRGIAIVAGAAARVAPPVPADPPFLTVVVPARNEEAALPRCLISLAAQDWPADRVEFLVVDDRSEDATAAIVERRAADDSRFRLLRSPGAGKKAAIALAVARARGGIVVTTDADCTHQPGWLRALAAAFATGADVVAGPVLLDDDGTRFGRLQALEFLGLVSVGAGLFGLGAPRLCNGANLAYRTPLFARAGAYAGNAHIASGDDEFLLHRMHYALGARTVFAASSDATVRTPPVRGVGAFLATRARWASKGRHYEDPAFVGFLSVLFAHVVCSVAAVAVAWTSTPAFAACAAILVVKWGMEAAVLRDGARLFGARVRAGDFAVAAMLHPFYLLFVTLRGNLGQVEWKGRRAAIATRG